MSKVTTFHVSDCYYADSLVGVYRFAIVVGDFVVMQNFTSGQTFPATFKARGWAERRLKVIRKTLPEARIVGGGW